MPEKNALYLTAKIFIAPEIGGYASWCPELDVASQGETVEEATTNLADAIKMFLFGLGKKGDLESYLEERGLHRADNDEPLRSVTVTPGEFVTSLIAPLGSGRVLV